MIFFLHKEILLYTLLALMNKLIVALDIENLSRALELIDILSPRVDCFKVGAAPFVRFDSQLLQKLQFLNKKIFLDLKFHDIPNTVKEATRASVQRGINVMTFHCLGGLRMLQAAVEAVNEVEASKRPLLLGITVLTSMAAEDMQSIGLGGSIQDKVIDLARLAKEAGLDGVVASAKEARMIKEKIGKDFIVVTPGIRPEWSVSNKEDQRRIVTPRQAISEGADYIVVGRPILQAEDPLMAANRIIEELEAEK